jgi:hypothetical protein
VWPDSPDEDLCAAEKVILEFHKLDPKSDTFRYACDKQGEKHKMNGLQIVDLLNLRSAVGAISLFLEAAYAGIEYCNPGPP